MKEAKSKKEILILVPVKRQPTKRVFENEQPVIRLPEKSISVSKRSEKFMLFRYMLEESWAFNVSWEFFSVISNIEINYQASLVDSVQREPPLRFKITEQSGKPCGKRYRRIAVQRERSGNFRNSG